MRKNNKLRKVLLTLCCAMLLVAISVGATVAYLTDKDTVNNTFTVGQVKLTLDETNVEGEGRDKANAYELIPGTTYTKDPTIHIDADSENCYVVAKIEVTGAKDLDGLLGYDETSDGKRYIGFRGIITGGVFEKPMTYKTDITANGKTICGWENDEVILTQEANDGNYTFHVYYKNAQKANTHLMIFEEISIPTDWSNSDIAKIGDAMRMDITAYAVQQENFENVFAAYEAGIAANWKA